MTTAINSTASIRNQTKLFVLHQQMHTALVPWVQFTQPHWNRFAALFNSRTIKEREHILLPGASIDELYFVCAGLLRAYYLGDDGAEANKAFISENAFAGPLPASVADKTVFCGIQALEPTTLLVARYAEITALLDLDPVFGQFQRRLAEWLLSRKEMRMHSLLHGGAREQYLDFVVRFPDLAQRVPQYHIASYLGISEVHLSRLRRTLTYERAS